MKKKILFILSMSFTGALYAQKDNVGIGTTKPDQSAVLEISSTNKGLLIPRMSLQQRGSISNPAQGLMIYQTDFISGFYFYDGKEWQPMINTAEKSVAGVDGDWTNIGNSGLTAGTHFIGNIDDVPLEFRVSNVRSGLINRANAQTYIGYEAGKGNTALFTTAIGYGALAGNNTGVANLAIGSQSLQANTTGYTNIAIGHNALQSNTTGYLNTAIGSEALKSNSVGGVANLAVGSQALYSNTSGNTNIAIGVNALYTNTVGNLNTAIGFEALKLSTSNGNTAVGAQALNKNTGATNVGIGNNTLLNNTAGSNNIAIGFEAGSANTGSNNMFLGYQAGSTETGSNKLYIANSNTATPLVYGDFSTKYLAVGEVAAADRAAATSGGYRLLVKGGMITEKIKVAVAGSSDWADYVFEPSYKLMSLDKVEAFVKENKHLPNVPSADEMSKNGLDVTQTTAKLMEKVEELTLYIIELNKEIKKLKEDKK